MEMFAVGENNFSGRLRWLRDEHLRIGLVQFADKIESSKGYVSDLERGVKSNPSRDFVEKVCNAYSVNIAWLENGVGEPFGEQPPSQIRDGASKPFVARPIYGQLETDTVEKNLIDLARGLPKVAKSERKYILGNIRAMLEELEEREMRPSPSSAPRLSEDQAILKREGDKYDARQHAPHPKK